jgi:outer membrane receptor protein involved in Fe transport
LAAAASGALGAGLATYLKPVADALMPNGPTGVICTSLPEETGTGVYGGHKSCAMSPQDFDRSVQYNKSWSAEAILSSKWDGKFNFLLGGIYSKLTMSENSYYVNSFGLDYFAGVGGAFTALGSALPPAYLATPFYRNNSDYLKVSSYGIFGEAYYKFDDRIKLTLGLRYNHDQKDIIARTTVFNWLVPNGSTNAYTSPYFGSYDADANLPGNQPFQVRNAKFNELTGRAVLDFQITPDNLIYLSYSRGYKSGGINPPLSPIFAVPETFSPEFVNAFEIGSKNQFGKLTLNLTGFYYKYKDLQLSRIVARTSVNDNVSANIWGLEAEAILRPTPGLSVNISASYLNTKVSEDKYLANPRDFGGGPFRCGHHQGHHQRGELRRRGQHRREYRRGQCLRQHGQHPYQRGQHSRRCSGCRLAANDLVRRGQRHCSTGAYSICAALQAVAATNGAAFDPKGITVYTSGIPVNIKGNKLPGAPDYKVAAGVQYEIPGGRLSITPRFDIVLTGTSTGNIFNGAVNRIPSYTQINAQVQIDGPDRRWFIRGFVQNLGNSNPITGLYVTDQSSGNFTNIFTLEPRRYGVAAGFRF